MITLLTGGSGCGKSSYGESMAVRLPMPRWYLAAMKPYGEGSQAKIERHRNMRKGKGFETVERYTDYAALTLPQKGGTALLECICNLAANEMFKDDGTVQDPCGAVMKGVKNLAAQCDNLLIITNDVGSDGCEYDPATVEYIRVMGKLNRDLAILADNVYELVAGIPIVLKGRLI